MTMPAYEYELHEDELHEDELHELESHEYEDEYEGEMEDEGEYEDEISPVRKIYADAMMEHLGHLAAESESEEEAAEHFLPLIGMAAKKLLPMVAKAVAPSLKRALPKIARAVTRVEPRLTRGITKIARTLYRQPATRKLLKAVPSIARRTMHSIARQVAHGRPLTARGAARTLVHQARRVLRPGHHRAHALRRSHLWDRRFHRHMGRGIVRPHWRWFWINGRRVRVPASHAPALVAQGHVQLPSTPSATTHTGGVPIPGVPGVPGVPAARVPGVGGTCPPCPSCGGHASPTPAYCRCCGQVMR
jgi:hypothetical protein